MEEHEELIGLLIGLLPAEYRAAAVSALQLVTAALAALSVLVPLVEKVVKATPSKSDDAYWGKLQRVRSVLSVFPRVVIPRISQAPTLPAPAPARAPHERPEGETTKLPVQWPSAEVLAELEAQAASKRQPSGE